MAVVEILTPDFVFEDERGKLVQLVHSGYKQFNIVTSKAGVLRGGHCHRQNREVFYIIEGSCEVEFTLGDVTEKHTFSAGDMFAVPPNVYHNFYYTSDSVLAVMYDSGVELENGGKDIWT